MQIFAQLGEGALSSYSLRLAATDRIRMGKLRSDEYAEFLEGFFKPVAVNLKIAIAFWSKITHRVSKLNLVSSSLTCVVPCDPCL